MYRGRVRIEEGCAAAIRQQVAEVHRDKSAHPSPFSLEEARFMYLPRLSHGNDDKDSELIPRYTFKDFKNDFEAVRRQHQ